MIEIFTMNFYNAVLKFLYPQNYFIILNLSEISFLILILKFITCIYLHLNHLQYFTKLKNFSFIKWASKWSHLLFGNMKNFHSQKVQSCIWCWWDWKVIKYLLREIRHDSKLRVFVARRFGIFFRKILCVLLFINFFLKVFYSNSRITAKIFNILNEFTHGEKFN